MAFDPEEGLHLRELENELRRVEEWPLDSPLAFVIHLAPPTRGLLGERLVRQIAVKLGVECRPSGGSDYDILTCRRQGDSKIEVKFSTEDPPRFQQVRDPRRQGTMKYDALICVSGRPDGIVYWIIAAADVATLIDSGSITIQHQDSRTHWFFPSRTREDAFAPFRRDFQGLRGWLKS